MQKHAAVEVNRQRFRPATGPFRTCQNADAASGVPDMLPVCLSLCCLQHRPGTALGGPYGLARPMTPPIYSPAAAGLSGLPGMGGLVSVSPGSAPWAGAGGGGGFGGSTRPGLSSTEGRKGHGLVTQKGEIWKDRNRRIHSS
jgi:hypothetical protein